jgi:hypothetical protein
MGTNKKRYNWVVDRWVSLDDFYSKQTLGANGCIEWTGVQNNIGYPFIGFVYPKGVTSPSGNKSGMMTAHRLAFMVHHNRAPVQRNVNHTCHNKICVNPQHLIEGTQRDKLIDMKAAGIHGGRPKGSSGYAYNHKQYNRIYKYSDEEIQWHRTAHSDKIAERYGISLKKAASKRWQFRNGYPWLPCPPYEPMKTGRKTKKNK